MHTFIKNLLNGQSAEWKTLGEVCDIKKGKQLNKTELKEQGLYPAYNGGKSHSGYTDNYNAEANTIIVSQGGASAGFVNFIETPFWANAHCYYILPKPNTLNRYLYHFLKNNEKNLMDNQHGAGIPALSQSKLGGLEIPIPPLEIQQKIVQILDAFTAVTAELTAEYNLRVKQYQYYRDKLLNFSDNVEWKSLGEVVPLQRGKRLIKNQLNENGQFAVFQNSLQPLGYYDESNCRAYMTFIISAGAAGEIGFSHKSFWAADDCYYFDCPKDFLNDRFLYYFLMTQKHKLTSQVRKASVPRLGRSVIEKIKIPIPPLETQTQIVEILDKFETLTHSISEGLPREIELRQKQYEYYRALLLNFDT